MIPWGAYFNYVIIKFEFLTPFTPCNQNINIVIIFPNPNLPPSYANVQSLASHPLIIIFEVIKI